LQRASRPRAWAAPSRCVRSWSASQLIDQVFRDEWGRVLATLVGDFGDFDLAEEATQDAFAIAAERWPRDGTPDNPGAWLTTTAEVLEHQDAVLADLAEEAARGAAAAVLARCAGEEGRLSSQRGGRVDVLEPGERVQDLGLAAARRADEHEPDGVLVAETVGGDGRECGVERAWVGQVEVPAEDRDRLGQWLRLELRRRIDRSLLVGPVATLDVEGERLEFAASERRSAAVVELRERGEDLRARQTSAAQRAGHADHRCMPLPLGDDLVHLWRNPDAELLLEELEQPPGGLGRFNLLRRAHELVRAAVRADARRQERVAARTARVEPGTEVAGARLQRTADVSEMQVAAALRRQHLNGRRQLPVLVLKPLQRAHAAVLDVDVEHVHSARRSGRHADVRVRPPRPPSGDLFRVGRGVVETVAGKWMLGGAHAVALATGTAAAAVRRVEREDRDSPRHVGEGGGEHCARHPLGRLTGRHVRTVVVVARPLERRLVVEDLRRLGAAGAQLELPRLRDLCRVQPAEQLGDRAEVDALVWRLELLPVIFGLLDEPSHLPATQVAYEQLTDDPPPGDLEHA
jgi:hypothetical protein